MKKSAPILIVLLLLFNAFSADAKIIYVSATGNGSGTIASPAGFQDALDSARTNGSHDTLLLAQGTYDASGGFSYDTTQNDGKNLLISGGWTSDYSANSDGPAETVLDGKGSARIMYIAANKPGLNYKVWIETLTFKNGYTTSDHGGALRVYEGLSNKPDTGKIRIYINSCDFINNQAMSNRSGGAIFIYSYFELIYCYFESNKAYNGGAIYAGPGADGDQSMSPLIAQCDFVDNTNYGNQGSTIWHNLALQIRSCLIEGRSDGTSSVGPGSAVWGNSGSYTYAYNTEFKNIHIPYWGSALQSFDGSMEVVNCVFTGNSCGTSSGYGTLAYFNNSGSIANKILISNCTFANSIAKYGYYGGIHIRPDKNDTVLIENTIVWGCGNIPIYREAFGVGEARYNDIQQGLSGSNFIDHGNNLNTDPLFVGGGDYTLSANSPCINAGNNDARLITDRDFDGRVRILNDTVDMGANEFNNPPTGVMLSISSVNENVPSHTFVGELAAKDPDKGDKFNYDLPNGELDNDMFSVSNGILYIEFSPNYEVKSSYQVRIRVEDSGERSAEDDFTITIKDINDAPTIADTIPDQEGDINTMFDFTMSSGTFSDEDGDNLTLTASMADGSNLPSWLSFDAGLGRFYGTPTQVAGMDIKVSASDGNLSAADTFHLEIVDPAGIAIVYRELKVYPNPLNGDYINVETDKISPETMEIYSSAGVMVRTVENPGSRIYVGDLQAGVYYLMFSVEGSLYRSVLVVQ